MRRRPRLPAASATATTPTCTRGQYAEQLARMRQVIPRRPDPRDRERVVLRAARDDLRRRARLPGAAARDARPVRPVERRGPARRCRTPTRAHLREHFSSHDAPWPTLLGTGAGMAVLTETPAGLPAAGPTTPRSSGGTGIRHRRCSWRSACWSGSPGPLTQPATYSATASVVARPGPHVRHPRRRPGCCRPRSASTPTPSCSSSPRVLAAVADALGTDPGAGPRAPLGHRVAQQPRAPRDRVTAPLRDGGRRGRQRRGRRRSSTYAVTRSARSRATSCASCGSASPDRRSCWPGAEPTAGRSRRRTSCSPRSSSSAPAWRSSRRPAASPPRSCGPRRPPRPADYANARGPGHLGRHARPARGVPARRRPRPPSAAPTSTAPVPHPIRRPAERHTARGIPPCP